MFAIKHFLLLSSSARPHLVYRCEKLSHLWKQPKNPHCYLHKICQLRSTVFLCLLREREAVAFVSMLGIY